MARPILMLLLATSGCAAVFDLESVDNPDMCSVDSHDEDGDGVTDGCDNCPGLSNPLQENDLERLNGKEEDAVGDVCDPRPMEPGDRIERFATFASPSEPMYWLPDGNWTFDGESVISRDPSLTNHLVDLIAQPAAPFTVDVGAILRNVPGIRFELMIEAHVDLAMNRRVTCGLIRYSGGEQFVHIESHDGDLAPPVEQDSDASYPTVPIVAGTVSSFRIVMTYLDASTLHCEVFGDSGRASLQASAPSLLTTAPSLALAAKYVDADFTYRLVYTH